VLTPVTDADMRICLAPYPTPDSRRPILARARRMPPGGDPAELVARIEA
jgi:haloalkane dehalogenase